MTSSASVCPGHENLTECLLRQVLQTLGDRNAADDAKYDWDPVTFAFTLPIGLFAAIFALVTIYQAILAAGSGRRKSNRLAIGRWAGKTRTEWSWNNLSRLSIATTPVLQSDHILQILSAELEDGPRVEPSPDPSGGKTTTSIGSGDAVKGRATREPGSMSARVSTAGHEHNLHVATWLQLLEHAGLQDLDTGNNIKTIHADYLPGDLLAAPAYAEIGFVVTLAAALGAHFVQVQAASPPYPVILGDGFQVDFRQHLALGTVAAFSRYRTDVRTYRTPSKEQLIAAIQHARGEVDITAFTKRFPIEISVLTISSVNLDSHFVMTYPLPPSNTLSAISRQHWGQDTIFAIKHKCEPLESEDEEKNEELCIGAKCCNVICDDHQFFWLLIADTPRHPPTVFPTALSHISPGILSTLVLNSKLWSSQWTDQPFNRILSVPHSDLSSTWYLDSTFRSQRATTDDLQHLVTLSENLQRGLPEVEILPGQLVAVQDNNVLAFPMVLQQCKTLISSFEAFQTWFGSLKPVQKQHFRILVLMQLQQLDKALLRITTRASSRLACRISTLYITTLTLLNAERALREKAKVASSEALRDGNEQERQQPDRWSALRAVVSPQSIPIQHLGILRAVDVLTRSLRSTQVGSDSDSENENPETPSRETGLAHHFNNLPYTREVKTDLFLRLKKVVDASFSVCAREYQRSADRVVRDEGEKRRRASSATSSENGVEGPKTRENTRRSWKVKEKGQAGEGGRRRWAEQGRAGKKKRWKGTEGILEQEHERRVQVDWNIDPDVGLWGVAHAGRNCDTAGRSSEEAVDDLLIWRASLVAMLFWMAPDNSAVLASGVWEHVVPIL